MEIISTSTNFHKCIHLDLNITTLCDINCSYCCNKDILFKFKYTKKDLEDVIKFLCVQKNLIHLNILGGEPSISPHLHWFVRELENIPAVTRVKIYTNGYKDLRTLRTSKVVLVYTIHGTYATKKHANIERVLELLQPQDICCIMDEPDLNIKDLASRVIKKGADLEISVIENNGQIVFSSNLLNEYRQHALKNGVPFLVEKNRETFKTIGKLCELGYYMIDKKLNIIDVCTTKIITNIRDMLCLNRRYVKCPYEYCLSGCFFQNRKFL